MESVRRTARVPERPFTAAERAMLRDVQKAVARGTPLSRDFDATLVTALTVREERGLGLTEAMAQALARLVLRFAAWLHLETIEHARAALNPARRATPRPDPFRPLPPAA